MSTTMAPRPPSDDLIVLTGEYVLGTLDREEARLLTLEAAQDPAIAEAIGYWEHRLAPLLDVIQVVAPPASLWPRIEATLGAALGAAATGGEQRLVPFRRASVAVWRGAAVVGFLLAAGFAGLLLVGRPPVAPRMTQIAVLAPVDNSRTVFLANAEPDGSVQLTPASPLAPSSGHSLQLWVLPQGARVPKPLGLIGPDGVRVAAADFPHGPAQLMISLEPLGGSPTGLPTGPVIYGGTVSWHG